MIALAEIIKYNAVVTDESKRVGKYEVFIR